MPKPMRGEQPPRLQFWHPHETREHGYTATLGGYTWLLTKIHGKGEWLLFGWDPDETFTDGEPMGTRVEPAKQAAEQWITKPWTRDAIRAAHGPPTPAPVDGLEPAEPEAGED